jgi:hypothetical protein
MLFFSFYRTVVIINNKLESKIKDIDLTLKMNLNHFERKTNEKLRNEILKLLESQKVRIEYKNKTFIRRYERNLKSNKNQFEFWESSWDRQQRKQISELNKNISSGFDFETKID